jgi:hypothetical protein
VSLPLIASILLFGLGEGEGGGAGLLYENWYRLETKEKKMNEYETKDRNNCKGKRVTKNKKIKQNSDYMLKRRSKGKQRNN